MKKIFTGSAVLAAMFAVTSATAADLPVKAVYKAPPVEVWTWTGFYVGGNVGYSWGRSRTDVSFSNSATGAPIVPPAGSITNASANLNGAIGGGQIGYNWQTNNVVWGLEADIQWSGQ